MPTKWSLEFVHSLDVKKWSLKMKRERFHEVVFCFNSGCWYLPFKTFPFFISYIFSDTLRQYSLKKEKKIVHSHQTYN